MISALVFDFDGLIVDTETPLVEAWVELHAEHGLPYELAKAHGVVGHVGIDFDPWSAFPTNRDRAELEREYRRRTRLYTNRQPVLPGVMALLDEAKRRGLRMAVASNSDHAHVERHLDRLSLRPYFAAIRCIDDVAAGKPAPDVYLAALKALDAPAATSVAFEDSVPGHVAAKRAGLNCVVVPNPSTAHFEFPHADLKLPSLAHTTFDELLARFSARTG